MKQFSFEDHKGQLIHVPDGMWVADSIESWWSEQYYGSYEDGSDDWSRSENSITTVAGTKEFVRHTIESNSRPNYGRNYSSRFGNARFMYVASEPFGLISGRKEDGRPVGGLYFRSARQVHKGELGRLPEIVRPRFARESREYGEGFHEWREGRGFKPMPKRDRHRGKKGWARLADVADIVRMTPEELVRRYFLFTSGTEPSLTVLFREHREDIHCRVVSWNDLERYAEHQLDDLFSRPDIRHAWIRQGFAKVVLYLHALGHVPEPVAVRSPEAIAV